MPDITMPNEEVVRFPDHFTPTQIRGLIAHKFPREVGELMAGKPASERDMTGHQYGLNGGQGLAGLSSAVEGMPIVGPAAQQGAEWLASRLGSALTGTPADQVQQEMGGMVDSAQAANPITSAAGGVGGAILGTLPAILAAPAAFGAGGTSLLGSSLISALTGGALGAGEGQEIVRSAIKTRDVGANQRIRGAINENLGPAYPPKQITGTDQNPVGLTGVQRRLGPEYERVLNNAKALNTEAIANDIQSQIANTRGEAQNALQRVLDMLSIKGTNQLDPHPRAALATRQAIDGMIGDTADTNVIRVLGNVRRSIDAELAKSAPNIKMVDQKYARLARQREAVDFGQKVLRSDENTIWPSELSAKIAKEGPVILGRMAQGARAEIERIVGTNANDRVALQRLVKGEGDWNRDKLAQLFGQGKADRIIKVLDDEARWAGSRDIVTRNSETAARQAAQKDVTVAERQPGAWRSAANLKFGDTTKQTVKWIDETFRGSGQEKTNTKLAEMLTSRDPQTLTRAIGMVQAAQRRGDISAAKAQQIVQSLTVAGGMEGRRRTEELRRLQGLK